MAPTLSEWASRYGLHPNAATIRRPSWPPEEYDALPNAGGKSRLDRVVPDALGTAQRGQQYGRRWITTADKQTFRNVYAHDSGVMTFGESGGGQ